MAERALARAPRFRRLVRDQDLAQNIARMPQTVRLINARPAQAEMGQRRDQKQNDGGSGDDGEESLHVMQSTAWR